MINFEDLGKRFSIYMKIKGLGVNETAKILDFSGSQISNITKGRVFGSDKIFKILNIFTDLSPEWLFTGKGSMLKEETISERLEQYKFENRLTYYDLGSILGITPFEMRELMRKNEVTEEHIEIISEKLETPKEWLLTGEGAMPKINRDKIDIVSESKNSYIKEDNKTSPLETENKLLKESNVSLKQANNSLKETNELLKEKIKGLEAENKILKSKMK